MVRRHESGAVSLFLVIFAMLLITVVTLSFLRIMLKDQAASSVSDLSQSAYDSAMAGTEDAKRALIYYRTLCNAGDPECSNTGTTINSTECNQGLKDIVETEPNKEVLIQESQSTSDNNASLNQAYTCVKIALDTVDYLGVTEANTSKLIPLKTTGDFSSVTIEWYNTQDLGSTTSRSLSLVSDSAASKPLYLQTNWPVNRPSLMRVQLMQFGTDFTLADFDNSDLTNSNTNTIFLYPTGRSGSSRTVSDTFNFTRDTRKTATGVPQPTRCSGLLTGGYACKTTLNLPQAIGQSDTTRTAYLRLTPLYNGAHFRISFNNNVKFSAVQPSIDSTGRANTQYRRVETRVDLVNTNFAFPEAALDLSGNLCKDFYFTDDASEFSDSCTP
jgi:hypothetical protein